MEKSESTDLPAKTILSIATKGSPFDTQRQLIFQEIGSVED